VRWESRHEAWESIRGWESFARRFAVACSNHGGSQMFQALGSAVGFVHRWESIEFIGRGNAPFLPFSLFVLVCDWDQQPLNFASIHPKKFLRKEV
jgi:hypothetical protein